MSDIAVDVSEQEWEQYLSFCRALNLHPTLSDFSVWKSDQNLDEDTHDY